MGKKKSKDKVRARIKEEKRKAKIAESTHVRYRCLGCGAEEDIPRDVVEMMDIQDGGDLSVPPRFSCEMCPEQMEPVNYKSVHGIIYKLD